MKLAACMAAMSMLVAGCAAPAGPAQEQLVLSVNDVGKSPWAIGVPLWITPGGHSPEEWVRNASIHAGNVTQFHHVILERGDAVWIVGNGTVTIGFEDIRSNVGDSFSLGKFSMGEEKSPWLWVEYGDVDLQWFYEGVSEDCFVTGSYWWEGNGTGWHQSENGGRISRTQSCP